MEGNITILNQIHANGYPQRLKKASKKRSVIRKRIIILKECSNNKDFKNIRKKV